MRKGLSGSPTRNIWTLGIRHISNATAILALFVVGADAQLPQDATPNASWEFVRVLPGEFVMGCSTGDGRCLPNESPAHKVKITRTFELGKYEVTQAQWLSVMTANPSRFVGNANPVESVAHSAITEFLMRMNQRNDGYRYRLPTEAEWEFAARSGSAEVNAGVQARDIAWYSENSENRSHPVGQKQANAWGLHDMLGNVAAFVHIRLALQQIPQSPNRRTRGYSAADPGSLAPMLRASRSVTRRLRGATWRVRTSDSDSCGNLLLKQRWKKL
jgi:formylglycine-generating enzyme required for sulfatase activity